LDQSNPSVTRSRSQIPTPYPSIPSRKRSSRMGSSDAGCAIVVTFRLRCCVGHAVALVRQRLSIVRSGVGRGTYPYWRGENSHLFNQGHRFAGGHLFPIDRFQGHSSRSKGGCGSGVSQTNHSAEAFCVSIRYRAKSPRAPVVHRTTRTLINVGDCSIISSASFTAASKSLIARRLSSTATRSSVHSAASRKLRREQSKTASEICIEPCELRLDANSPEVEHSDIDQLPQQVGNPPGLAASNSRQIMDWSAQIGDSLIYLIITLPSRFTRSGSPRVLGGKDDVQDGDGQSGAG
jgi:hypothetical protein